MVKNYRRELITGTAFIVGSFVAFAIAAYFLTDMIATEADKISAGRDAIQSRAALIQGLAEQKSRSLEVKRVEQNINLILPTKDDLVNYQSWLDGLSRARQISTNFYFSGETVLPTDASPGYIKFVLNADGTYSSLVDFLRDVEFKSPHYTTKLDNFDMRKNGETYTAIVNGRTFFR